MVLATIVLGVGCGEDPVGPIEPPGPPSSPATVTVAPREVSLGALGDTARLIATARAQDGRTISGVTVTWSSSDVSVATVDTTGLVTAAGDGHATVRAALGTISGAARIVVEREAHAITLIPTERIVSVGDTLRLIARGEDRNGFSMSALSFRWSSDDRMVATVDSTGLVRTIGEGRVGITAMAGAVSATATITVTGVGSDREALLALYHSTGGASWLNNDNWLTDEPLEDWYGIEVDAGGRVVEIDLRLGGLDGVIPPELGGLSELTLLDVSYNRLRGPIPAALGNLARLRILDLEKNRLTGTVPVRIGDLASLRGLNLADNELAGPLPSTILRLDNLVWLTLQSFYNRRQGVTVCIPGIAEFIEWSQGLWTPTASVAIPLPQAWFCNAADRQTLGALYENTAGESWTNSDGWMEDGALADWHGVSTDSLGRVRRLDLSGNGLVGAFPAILGRLSVMTELRMVDNALTGSLPVSLIGLHLLRFDYAGNDVCVPPDPAFRRWLSAIPSRVGTDAPCPPLAYRPILVSGFEALGGQNWTRSDNWLSDAPLGAWYGVEVGDEGQVTALRLDGNRLEGAIPRELADLPSLAHLSLTNNHLHGTIPAELGTLVHLNHLALDGNRLTDSIPKSLGRLPKLKHLSVSGNDLSGRIPYQLGDLSGLRLLDLSGNRFSGRVPGELTRFGDLEVLNLSGNGVSGIPYQINRLSRLQVLDLSDNAFGLDETIPPELGDLPRLKILRLGGNAFSSGIPPELGQLGSLEVLELNDNNAFPRFYQGLTGNIPPELGTLASLRVLDLSGNALAGGLPAQLGKLADLESLDLGDNELEGPVPKEFGDLTSLRRLRLANNPQLAGPLPAELAQLRLLIELSVRHTQLCVPDDSEVQHWLEGTGSEGLAVCGGSNAYLTQAVQSLYFPVPLVADEPALLRVFVVAPNAGSSTIPPVRARFYTDGSEIHVVDIPAGSTAIPAQMDEGSLVASVNVDVPSWVLQPGLEIAVEVDPDGTLDPGLGVATRLPARGRSPIDVRAVPPLDLMLIPFLHDAAPDSSILSITDRVTAGDELFWATRALLPVGELNLSVHVPVVTSTTDAVALAVQTRAIRTLEQGSGHYMGMMTGTTTGRGAAYIEGWSSFAVPQPLLIATQLGHNMGLEHAPCGTTDRIDRDFPTSDGSIGIWGYDFRARTLVSPATPDLMSACGPPQWISGYHFAKALRYRLEQGNVEDEASLAGGGAASRTLLIWGGTDEQGVPFLEPAFVVDAAPLLPEADGEYEVAGRAIDGRTLFSLSFGMPELAGEASAAGFAFTVPADSAWADSLASITLSGPGGSVSLDADSDQPTTIIFDPIARRVRGILRHSPHDLLERGGSANLVDAVVRRLGAERGVTVLTSRGLPERHGPPRR